MKGFPPHHCLYLLPGLHGDGCIYTLSCPGEQNLEICGFTAANWKAPQEHFIFLGKLNQIWVELMAGGPDKLLILTAESHS